MRDGAKTPRPTGHGTRGRRVRAASAALSVVLIATGLLAFSAPAPAPAATVTDRPLLFSFDGSDTTAGQFVPGHPFPAFPDLTRGIDSVAVDDSSGDVYVFDNGAQAVDRFDAAGNAKDFTAGPAAGTSSLYGPSPGQPFSSQNQFFMDTFSDLAVDNSAVNPGRLYVSGSDGGPLDAFDPQGNFLWALPVPSACGITVDAAGHLWVGTGSNGTVLEFAASGSPPAQIGSFAAATGNKSPCRLGIDQSGKDTYIAFRYANFGFGGPNTQKYVEGAFDSILTSSPTRALAVDQTKAGGHIFTLEKNPEFPVREEITRLEEYEPCPEPGCAGKKVAGSPFGHGLIGNGVGVAHSAYEPPGEGPLDRVYVSDSESKSVKVFGPLTTGTVPDVTTQAADGVTHNAATAHGTINPQGVNNSYHFEWKRGTGPNWATAQSSPPQSIAPTDSADHAVSFAIGGLASATTYQVRLVGTNTANDLSSYSSPPVAFQTPVPPVPVITNLALSAIATGSAHLAATLDPQEETTTWKVQKSTDPICSGTFTDLSTQTISNPGPGTVAIAYDLTGLLPAQTYCVRLSAKNGNPVPATADRVIQTLAVPPTGVDTAFAAPRTDTTARINAYLNPEGEADVTYRFELSTDGVNWTVRDPLVSTRDARTQIVVADELTGLAPATTYHYRLGLVENSGDPATSLGGEKTFTTRTSAEMDPPSRGFELVNNPDKGNQDVQARLGGGAPMSADGERAIWDVFGGAPGGNVGTGATFLAERTPGGWVSRSLVPPAARQFDPEGAAYSPLVTTPDFTRFIFAAGNGSETMVRLDSNQNQEILKVYESGSLAYAPELTDDGVHVLSEGTYSGSVDQLEDIGSGAPEVVSLLPDGSEPECGMAGEGQSFSGGGKQWRRGYHRSATTDASRVYFQVNPDGECHGSSWWLLERNREAGETLEVAPPDPSNALIRATPDGRSAFFVTDLALDAADTNSDLDVYRWDEEGEAHTCLTCVVADANLRHHRHVMVSDDFSHVYFESTSQLTPRASAGEYNLYALSGGTIRYVATPDSEEALGRSEAELSADGNVLLFKTIETGNQELTADQLAPSCFNLHIHSPGPCREIFRYDDRDGSLECISCNHGGLTTSSADSSNDEGVDFKLSADGETVAFVTSQALVPRDVNNGRDLYEWRSGAGRLVTDGVGSFQQSGTAGLKPYALSADGRDILFAVVDPGLTGFEHDGFANLYDARIGGGFTPPSPPAHCSEEACQGPLQAPPPSIQPGSSTFSGRGNFEEGKPSCARGRVRRHGRCVKRRRPHQRNHYRRAAGAKRGRAK